MAMNTLRLSAAMLLVLGSGGCAHAPRAQGGFYAVQHAAVVTGLECRTAITVVGRSWFREPHCLWAGVPNAAAH